MKPEGNQRFSAVIYQPLNPKKRTEEEKIIDLLKEIRNLLTKKDTT
jgi:hypothetical protein